MASCKAQINEELRYPISISKYDKVYKFDFVRFNIIFQETCLLENSSLSKTSK